MARVMITDTECTSLDTENGYIQELAWALWDTNLRRFTMAKSQLLHWNQNYEIEPGAFEVTGLSKEICYHHGNPAFDVISDFLMDLTTVDYLGGHNFLGYDRPMLMSNIKRALFADARTSPFAKLPVIDTLLDCPFPKNLKQLSLKYLALDHGYVLTGAHQALNDVYACGHILSCYDFKQVLEIASTPIVTLVAKVDFQNIEARDKLKNMRFYWKPERKTWEKKIRQYYFEEIKSEVGVSLEISN